MNGKLSGMFEKFLAERNISKQPIIDNEIGTPFFSDDAPTDTSDYLARLVRIIFNHVRVTKEMFHRKHTEMSDKLGYTTKLADQDRNNLRRALQRAEITWFVFEKAITSVMEFRILDLVITLQHPRTGKIIRASLTGVKEMTSSEYQALKEFDPSESNLKD